MRGWRWLAPAVVVLLAVTAWPIGRAVWTSLHTQPLTNPEDRAFVGLDTYVQVLTSRSWWIAVAATLAIVAVAVLLQLVLGLAFAAALRRLTAWWPVTRVLVLLPFAMLAVVSAVVWRDAVTTGFAADWFRIDDVGPVGQLVAVSLAEVWRGTGITAVILLAGLLRVSSSLMASAVADGATAWQRFRRVVLPAMAPAIAVAATYRALDALRMLEGPLVVDDPASDVRTVPVVVWDSTFSRFELGLGAATSVLLLLLAALLAAVLVPLLRVRRVV
ncbi:carbohydrate ABC transporter permease [Aeromicrobium chenweiae]|uniref:ABC transporter permease n=1 Tax=Aeromicrobium chenweiae TaxID=2079793 RepID=A0A2S0WP55_9ACTN|nr:sugar ABC transporter permease [Aeromicrobium chenweiae]AWB93096.1 ABC transporter permease [Aeromicrobium chenweiae]TGN34084.1 sugar ABC transporter permease [Aeromicrobium chenweiae]